MKRLDLQEINIRCRICFLRIWSLSFLPWKPSECLSEMITPWFPGSIWPTPDSIWCYRDGTTKYSTIKDKAIAGAFWTFPQTTDRLVNQHLFWVFTLLSIDNNTEFFLKSKTLLMAFISRVESCDHNSKDKWPYTYLWTSDKI